MQLIAFKQMPSLAIFGLRLVFPLNNDQNINAWLIKRNKVGIPLSPSELTRNQVKLAVKKVIEDIEIQNHLQHFKNLLKKSNGQKTAADEIMSFLTVEVPS